MQMMLEWFPTFKHSYNLRNVKENVDTILESKLKREKKLTQPMLSDKP